MGRLEMGRDGMSWDEMQSKCVEVLRVIGMVSGGVVDEIG